MPEMQDVMQGQQVDHNGGDEAGAVTLVLKLTSDLVRTSPQLRTQQHGLCKVPDVNWHAGLLGMSQSMAVAMRVVEDKMLVKESRVEDGDVLSHQVLVPIQGLSLVVAYAVVPGGRPELLGLLISPGHPDG